MKDMEIKTENRYEYRKTQEKRKQMIAPDLFEFAYVPDWYGHLAELERLGNTCLTLEMAYLNARVVARPMAPWLTELVK